MKNNAEVNSMFSSSTTTNRGFSMNSFRKSGIALTLAFIAASVTSQAQAMCCTQPAWWQIFTACPTVMDEAVCVGSKALAFSYYPRYAIAAYMGAKYGYQGAQWAAHKAAQSPKAQAALAWAKNKVSRAPQTKKAALLSKASAVKLKVKELGSRASEKVKPVVAGTASAVGSVVKPFGDRPEYAQGYFKKAQPGKWLFTRTDKDGNRFETDWLFRLKKDKMWSGKRYAVASTAQATKDRIAAVVARFGTGKAGKTAMATSNFMNRHNWVGNAVYYPALAAAGYYGFKGAELAYEKISDIWADYQAQDILSGIIDRANEQLENPAAIMAKSPLTSAVQQDEYLVNKIGKMAVPRQVALRAAMSEFDKAFSLKNPQERAAALNQAVDTISTVCNNA